MTEMKAFAVSPDGDPGSARVDGSRRVAAMT
jgi:hypothetical protein